MTKCELAEALIKSEGKCFELFTRCSNCPIVAIIKKDDVYCSMNQSERLAWAENYIAEAK